MWRSDYYQEFHPSEFLVEAFGIVRELSGPYLFIDWYVEDPDPEEDTFMTSEHGSCLKQRIEHHGKRYIRCDYAFIAKS